MVWKNACERVDKKKTCSASNRGYAKWEAGVDVECGQADGSLGTMPRRCLRNVMAKRLKVLPMSAHALLGDF